jgi:lactoylglutathione lyase
MTNSLQGNTLSVSLTVKDIEQSLHWYCDLVGFTVAEKHEREGTLMAVSLRAGKAAVLLTQDDGAKGLDRVKGAGFSLQITTDQNLDELAQHIKDGGGTLINEPTDTPWGVRMFRLLDPDGFKFTISSERR